MVFPTLTLTEREKTLASTVEGATNRSRDVRMWIAPFNFMACLPWGSHPRKKCPAAWLFALGRPM